MLRARLSLLQAVSLNMAMMVGIGPFITIPDLLNTMGGPQAMIGWILGAIVALSDGLVWSELAALFPGSGGTYHFFDALFGRSPLGRLLRFLFVWQFLCSAPLEVATGAIGLAKYAEFLAPRLGETAWSYAFNLGAKNSWIWEVKYEQILAILAMLFITGMAYRRIEAAGRLVVVLWGGMLLTVAWVIGSALYAFEPSQAFAFPANAFHVDRRFALGLGAALTIAMYDYLGYYQICYMGDEVADAPRTLPRAILISVVMVALIYLFMNISILGVVPWDEVIGSKHIATDVMQKVYGYRGASVVTFMIIWTASASAFAALLGYSRVPYAAAKAGHFFRGLAATHPTGGFPHRSLLLVGGIATIACLFDLVTVISALLVSRIPVQFVAQIAAVFYLRTRPEYDGRMPFRMWLYPLPALISLAGWLYILATSEPRVLVYGLASLVLGAAMFAIWGRKLEDANVPEAEATA
ncbi:APC family permease [Singulisphaera sp. PoT]|uniref:APC family permease n=1 Tax=Singulisphaera sp. PoT TaxID=3411797 RepID=UPI003BF46813